jgi:hypothetical protein
MSTYKAKKALEENQKRFLNPRTDPVMWNLHVALKELVSDISDIESALSHISRQVADVARHMR